ncbi:MAG: hypothetical protein ACM3SQ_06220 [Betaproteobacteria bacterium]
MLLVRYVGLVALAIWVGGMIAVGAIDSPDTWRAHVAALGYVCGPVLIVCYVILKLVGPPPHSFTLRVGIAVVMVMVAAADRFLAASAAPLAIDSVLGLVLLSWYVRE